MNKERQYGGFSAYVSATLILVLVLVWSLLPQSMIKGHTMEMLFDVLPQRYWVIVIQCFILMLMLFTYIGMLLYNTEVLTAPLDNVRTFTDSQGRMVEYKNQSELQWYFHHETSGVMDLPVNEVSRLLYLHDQKLYDNSDDE